MSYRVVKRVFDIVFSLFFLLVFSPLIVLVSFCILIFDGFPILATDPIRITRGGKSFRMYKFRSMVPDAHELINRDEGLKKIWLENDRKISLRDDPRITRVGRVIRSFDIDEIPQFINVLKGDMSVVGPRPVYMDIYDDYIKNGGDVKNIRVRDSVLPGITGIWQVSGRNDIPFDDQMDMEVDYVKGLSFLNDLKIFLKTPIVVLTRKGAK